MSKPIKLRDYQEKTIDDTFFWMKNNKGNPCAVLPTGAGKSIVVAEFCKIILKFNSSAKIIMLAPGKELIEQNYEKLITIWPNVPCGIYCAGLNQKDLNQSITFASIGSIHKKYDIYGHCDLILIDEAHLINHKDEGMYRNFISSLMFVNPNLRVIGLTATPFRMGHGLITDKPAIFDELIEPITIEELQTLGFLSQLKSKTTNEKLDTSNLHTKNGEYIQKELEEFDSDDINEKVLRETIEKAENRKSWLFFCVSIEHCEHIKEILKKNGITAESITSNTPAGERKRILRDFMAGRIQALTNRDVLTTGFDYPDIDLIVMLRPTKSPSLYVQMAGRGLRVKSHTDHCLVLDFAGNVERLGPITGLVMPSKPGKKDGLPPSKECPECDEIVHSTVRKCPECGHEFPPPQKKDDEIYLRNHDIMGLEPEDMYVTFWRWSTQKTKKDGSNMMVVEYYGGNLQKPVKEYFCVNRQDYGGHIARRKFNEVLKWAQPKSLSIQDLNNSKMPALVKFKRKGHFAEIIYKEWKQHG